MTSIRYHSNNGSLKNGLGIPSRIDAESAAERHENRYARSVGTSLIPRTSKSGSNSLTCFYFDTIPHDRLRCPYRGTKKVSAWQGVLEPDPVSAVLSERHGQEAFQTCLVDTG